MAQLRNVSENCGYNEYIANALTFPPNGHFEDPSGIKKNGEPKKECDIFDSIFEEIFWINPCWASYNHYGQNRLLTVFGRIYIKLAR